MPSQTPPASTTPPRHALTSPASTPPLDSLRFQRVQPSVRVRWGVWGGGLTSTVVVIGSATESSRALAEPPLPPNTTPRLTTPGTRSVRRAPSSFQVLRSCAPPRCSCQLSSSCNVRFAQKRTRASRSWARSWASDAAGPGMREGDGLANSTTVRVQQTGAQRIRGDCR